MSKKHNVRKNNSGSHYKERLQFRGLNVSHLSDPKLSDGKLASAKR